MDCVTIYENRYYPSNSSTFEDLNFEIEWNQFTVEPEISMTAKIAKDIVQVGNIEVKSHLFLISKQGNTDYSASNWDGGLGIALSGLSHGYPTYIDSLKSAGVIDKKNFSLYIQNRFSYQSNLPSHLEIGSYDLNTYSSSGKIILKVPITMDDYLGSDLMDIYFGGFILNTNSSIVFNYETEGIQASQFDIDYLFDYLQNSYTCTHSNIFISCDCYDTSIMPSFVLKYCLFKNEFDMIGDFSILNILGKYLYDRE